MKKNFLDYSLKLIKKYDINIDDTKLDEIRYGLEGTYLTISKLIIIIIMSIYLKILGEMIIMLTAFNILRYTGFGLHAKKSWACLISSSITFILFPLLAKIIIISFYSKIILGIIAIILIYKYSPADTEKRPIINRNRREIYKFITTVNCILLVILSLLTNNVLSNLIIFGIYCEIIIILPITYKILKLNYDNYKYYNGLNI